MAIKFRISHFLDVGDLLHKNPYANLEEALYRTAISRIYYTAYLFIMEEMNRKGKGSAISSISKGGVHEKLIIYLQSASKEETILGGLLEKLKELRTKADYKPYEPLDDKAVSSALSIFSTIQIKAQALSWMFQ